MGEVKLFRTWSSPYALRIVWVLKLKGIEYENVYEDLANKSSLLLEYNPIHKKVPVLLHNGTPICESLVMLEYIDETISRLTETWSTSTRFLPEDPLARATARFWAKFNDEQVLTSVFRVYVSQGVEQEEAKGPALENLDMVEKQLTGKKFFGRDKFGFLDLVFRWIANYVGILEETAGIKLLEGSRFPLICAWKENFSEVPVIKDNWPDQGKMITKFKLMREHFKSTAAVNRTV